MSGKATKEKKVCRFWKPKRELTSVEWDGGKNRARFEFFNGFFETDDATLAAELRERGYLDVTDMPADEVAMLPPKPPQDDVPEHLRPVLRPPEQPVVEGQRQQPRTLKADKREVPDL